MEYGGTMISEPPSKCSAERNPDSTCCGTRDTTSSAGLDTGSATCGTTQLPIIWQRLVSADGKTCPRCDATYQHLASAVAKLKGALAPLNIEPTLQLREIDRQSFITTPSESKRIWIAGKSLEEWLGASVGSSKCCSVCGDAPCRTMEIEGTVYEEVPEVAILKAALIAASKSMTSG